MKTKHYLSSLAACIVMSLAVSAFTSRLGLDSYQIYLNDKLILEHYVNQPLNLRKLQLHDASPDDQLRVFYRHCHEPATGTARSLIIKDQKGNTLKQWQFADVSGKDKGMAIPVGELTALEKGHAGSELSLHYTARQMPAGQMLASLHFGAKRTAAK